MSTFTPVFRSPIKPSELAAHKNFQLRDDSGAPVVLIQGAVADLLASHFASIPDRPGDLVALDLGWLARLTATQFYLFGTGPAVDLPTAATLETTFRQANRFAHATEYGGGMALIRLTGLAAPTILSKLCGLDFHDKSFPNLRVAQSSVAKIKALIARHDEGQIPGYSLHVDAPSGQYLWETLTDAWRRVCYT